MLFTCLSLCYLRKLSCGMTDVRQLPKLHLIDKIICTWKLSFRKRCEELLLVVTECKSIL